MKSNPWIKPMLVKNTIYQSMDYKKTMFPTDQAVRKRLPCRSAEVLGLPKWSCRTAADAEFWGPAGSTSTVHDDVAAWLLDRPDRTPLLWRKSKDLTLHTQKAWVELQCSILTVREERHEGTYWIWFYISLRAGLSVLLRMQEGTQINSLNRLKSCYQKRKNHYKKWKSSKGQAKGWNRDWSQWVIQGMYKNHWRKKCVKGTAVQK